MKKAEVEQLTNIMEAAILRAVQPIHEDIITHRNTLYGPNGNNGLCGKVKEHDEVIADYKSVKKSVKWIAAGVGTVVGIIVKLIPSPFR